MEQTISLSLSIFILRLQTFTHKSYQRFAMKWLRIVQKDISSVADWDLASTG